MTSEQMEHALKVMYEEIKKLKKRIDELDTALGNICISDNNGYSKRDYHGVDNYSNR